ncbi:hypothetical protein BT63DRAFT_427704 [Microthyrium microscopicum]|uniref:DNA-directed DNA polymerase n=1 Tax=Microthyrium microscopicum TaxID=703497 RepID=A0A6A6U1C7_9PEZI|nr:hypothetical protein BT63DRAFT_427704 [Microthyrium microscopicum]
MATVDQYMRAPQPAQIPTVSRPESTYHSLTTFNLPTGGDRKYSTQFADLYFARLALLKRHVEATVHAAWKDFDLDGERATAVERVLDVRQGELSWVIGTIFMDMKLKPNILDDIIKEAFIIAPPPRETYRNGDKGDRIVIEDESGRLPITGKFLHEFLLCTGCIVGILGTENKNGEFEVIDIKPADLPAQPPRWNLHNLSLKEAGEKPIKAKKAKGKIAIVSGLAMDGHFSDVLLLDMLQEYLLGETGGAQESSQISRLIIAGNSFADMAPIPTREVMMKNGSKSFSAEPNTWNADPTEEVDDFLASLLPTLPITLLPGVSDPTSVSMPQPALHSAMFSKSRLFIRHPTEPENALSWFDSVSNPWDGEIDGWKVLATGGQPVNDMNKYVNGGNRLDMMESILRWRNVAPTAPDTLWTYPYDTDDPFVLRECPHLYIVGDQPQFQTRTITGPSGQSVRLVAVPSFRKTGTLVLVDGETLEVSTVQFAIASEHKKQRNAQRSVSAQNTPKRKPRPKPNTPKNMPKRNGATKRV